LTLQPPPLPLPSMPLEKSDAILDLSDLNVVLGPHKYCPAEHLLGNGDLLVCKKKKKDQDNVSTGITVSSATDNSNHILSSMPLPPLLSLTNQATNISVNIPASMLLLFSSSCILSLVQDRGLSPL